MLHASPSPHVSRSLAVALIMLGLASLGGCREREQPNLNPPDSLLIDSLSLTVQDHVHRVIMTSSNTSESVQPREVTIEPGHFVEFFTQDRRVRTVSFLLDSLTAEQSEFLRSTAQDRSPPLVEMETRYVVSFREAPAGRYPFVVDGNDRAIRGAVVVASPEPDR